jgi:hypothetical protein
VSKVAVPRMAALWLVTAIPARTVAGRAMVCSTSLVGSIFTVTASGADISAPKSKYFWHWCVARIQSARFALSAVPPVQPACPPRVTHRCRVAVEGGRARVLRRPPGQGESVAADPISPRDRPSSARLGVRYGDRAARIRVAGRSRLVYR